MARTRVLIVEKAGLVSERLGNHLDAATEVFEVVGPPVVAQGMDEAVARCLPGLVLLEAVALTAEVTSAVETVMSARPTRVVLFVETAEQGLAAAVLLSSGALEVLVLPHPGDQQALENAARHLQLLATVPVVNHPRGHRRHRPEHPVAARTELAIVAVAASLGGPKALQGLFRALPVGFGPPIVVCQHITPGFSDDLARWLASETGKRVVEGREGLALGEGDIVVAPAHLHMRVSARGGVHLEDAPPVGGFRPSCDVLLESVAEAFGATAAGVVLTGMGRDGAQGLRAIRLSGGHTIAEARSTCVVFGMPKEAIALGAAELVLPLDQIAPQLVRWCA